MREQLIASIRVEKLYGLYTYRLPQEGTFQDAAILYGDNGIGKSTILRLAFHLLSAADNRNHRSALLGTPFRSFEVALGSGVTLSASRSDEATDLLTLSISDRSTTLATWDFRPGATRESHSSEWLSQEHLVIDENGQFILRQPTAGKREPKNATPRGKKAYLSALASHVPTAFILNADRRLDSDSVADPSDEVELRRVMRFGEPKRINDLVVRSREIALSQAMSAAGRWISRKAFQGANQGSMNVHAVYGAVLRHLVTASPKASSATAQPDATDLAGRLASIESKTSEFARYELATPLSTAEFRKALGTRSLKKKALSAGLLEPYVRSLESRLEALDPIFRIVDKFVTIVNGLLSDKSMTFRPSQGFSIHNRLGAQLEPSQLSSGEQQLLLLLCYVLIAREQPSVFMIDEPEISLNIKWQRQLVQSLLDLTQGANTQFIFASHSMELLAQHRNRVVKLVGAQ